MKNLIFVFCICLGLLACSKENCDSKYLGDILTFTKIADTISLGTTLKIGMQTGGRDGCSSFDQFLVTTSNATNVTDVSIVGQIKSVGCTCTMVAPIFNDTLLFTPARTGWYRLLFYRNYTQGSSIYDSLYVK
jgi:hypothetical protein